MIFAGNVFPPKKVVDLKVKTLFNEECDSCYVG